MRMLLKSALPATFVLLALGIATGLPGQFRPNNESAQFVPFVSHEREVAFSAEGAITEIQDRSYARRRDGSSYSKFTFTWVNGASESGDSGLVVIWDLARHAVIAIDGTTQSVTTTYLSPARVSSHLGEEHACANVERRNLVTSTIGSILGYNVSEEAESASDENWRRWDAKNLDCYPLKEKTEFLDADGGWIEDSVLDLREGDPPEALFEVPADYTERSPEQVEAAHRAKFHGNEYYGADVTAKLEQQHEEGQKYK
jgi:hypothetical protein